MTSEEHAASATATAQDTTARGRRGLVGVAGLAALSQALLQTQAFTNNPGVLMPGSDGKVIWERAAAIAPPFSRPLHGRAKIPSLGANAVSRR